MGNTVKQSLRSAKVFAAVICAIAGSIALGCSGQPTTGPFRGALPYDPERDPVLTRAHLGSRNFSWADGPPGQWTGELICHVASNCDGASTLRFQITAEQNARSTPMVLALDGTDPARGGYIVARLINLDQTHGFRPFGMTAHDTAYLWVGPTKNGSKRFAIYRIPNAQPPVFLAKANRTNFCERGTLSDSEIHLPPERPCLKPQTLYPSQVTKDNETPAGTVGFPRQSSATRSIPVNMFAMSDADGLWVSCSGGCCEAAEWALN